MAETRKIILNDDYGNSLENFALEGKCECFYEKTDGSSEKVLDQALTKGSITAELPAIAEEVSNVRYKIDLEPAVAYKSADVTYSKDQLRPVEIIPVFAKKYTKKEKIEMIEKQIAKKLASLRNK
jgi:hypothetical protein